MSTFNVFPALGTVVLSLGLLLPSPALAQHGGGHGGGSSGHFGGYHGGMGSFHGGHGSVGGSHSVHGSFPSGYWGYGGYRGYYGRGYYYPHYGYYPRYYWYPRYYGYYGYPLWGFNLSLGYGYWPYYSYWSPAYYYYPAYPYPQGGVEQSAEQGGTPSAPDRFWLIALKDDTTFAVKDYWVEDSKLNYVTRLGVRSSVELGKVDLDFTRQLNHERGMEFQLSRPKVENQPRPRDYGKP